MIWAMARHDLAVWFQSPGSIASALLPALGLGILVAMLTNSVGRQPVALVVDGHGRFADRMANLIRGDADAYWLSELSAADAQAALGEQRVVAIVAVPENFDEGVADGRAVVDLYLNNIDIDVADDIRRSVTRSVAQFDAPQLGLLGELNGVKESEALPNAYRIAVSEHDLRETNVSYLQYQVIPIILLIVLSGGMLGGALLTSRDFTSGNAKMMILSPAGRRSLILGRLVGGTTITLAMVLPMVIIGFFTRFIPACSEDSGSPLWLKLILSGPCGWNLPVPSGTHALALLVLLLVVTWAAVGLGILLGILVREERLVAMTGLNLANILFFLGGGFTTVAFLPQWIQQISQWVPTKYAIDGLRTALFYPDLEGIGHDLLVLAVCALVSVLIAIFSVARRWGRA